MVNHIIRVNLWSSLSEAKNLWCKKTYIINLKTMENENKSTIWSKIIKITITLLTAIATAFGLQACGVL